MSPKTKQRRRRRVILLASAAVLFLYFGAYLHFRADQVFIHRAGKYFPRPGRAYPRSPTNHFIQPAGVTDSPQLFGAVLTGLLGDAESGELDMEKLDGCLADGNRQVERMRRRRDRLFLLFRPATFLETLVWKIADPHPLD